MRKTPSEVLRYEVNVVPHKTPLLVICICLYNSIEGGEMNLV